MREGADVPILGQGVRLVDAPLLSSLGREVKGSIRPEYIGLSPRSLGPGGPDGSGAPEIHVRKPPPTESS